MTNILRGGAHGIKGGVRSVRFDGAQANIRGIGVDSGTSSIETDAHVGSPHEMSIRWQGVQ
jgi:hypothetical protein